MPWRSAYFLNFRPASNRRCRLLGLRESKGIAVAASRRYCRVQPHYPKSHRVYPGNFFFFKALSARILSSHRVRATCWQEKSTSVHHGSSLRALHELAKEMTYELVATTTFNGIFVARETLPASWVSGLDPDQLHTPSMISEIFQLYDVSEKIREDGAAGLSPHEITK